MITGKPIKILSMGTYFPRQVLSSEIEKRMTYLEVGLRNILV